MSASTIAPHAAAAGGSAAGLFAIHAAKTGASASQSTFDAVLQNLSAHETQAGQPERAKTNDGGEAAISDPTKDDASHRAFPNPGDAQPGFDPAAALAALVAPQATNSSVGVGQSTGASAPPIGATVPGSAAQAWAARLQAQNHGGDSAAIGGVGMPSDSTAQLALGSTPTVAPAVIDVHVQSARTFLGVSGSAATPPLAIDGGSRPTAPLAIDGGGSRPTAPLAIDGGGSRPIAPLAIDGGGSRPTAPIATDRGVRVKPPIESDGGDQGAAAAANAAKAASPQTCSAINPNGGRQMGGDARRDKSNAAVADAPKRGAATDATSAAPVASAASDLASAGSAAPGTPISLAQLPDLIAKQAPTPAAPANAATTPAGAANLNPVKELQVQLNPADLGSLTVKMRLADGNLAVVIETAKDSTATLIDGERDAIARRLASVDQPVASLLIQTSGNAPMQGENGNAAGSATPQQSDAQNSAANGSHDQPRSSRDESQAHARQANLAADEASRRAGSGDLFV